MPPRWLSPRPWRSSPSRSWRCARAPRLCLAWPAPMARRPSRSPSTPSAPSSSPAPPATPGRSSPPPLAEQGPRHLLLPSRRGPQAPGIEELVTELAELGAEVDVIACDVADRPPLRHLLDSIPAEPPLAP